MKEIISNLEVTGWQVFNAMRNLEEMNGSSGGRVIVCESNGEFATLGQTSDKTNEQFVVLADGKREIFLDETYKEIIIEGYLWDATASDKEYTEKSVRTAMWNFIHAFKKSLYAQPIKKICAQCKKEKEYVHELNGVCLDCAEENADAAEKTFLDSLDSDQLKLYNDFQIEKVMSSSFI